MNYTLKSVESAAASWKRDYKRIHNAFSLRMACRYSKRAYELKHSALYMAGLISAWNVPSSSCQSIYINTWRQDEQCIL